MRKPPCLKCGATHVYLQSTRTTWRDEVYLGCYVCGWRLYGETQIQTYVLQHTSTAETAEAAQLLREKQELVKCSANRKDREAKIKKQARDRRYREKKRMLRLMPSEIPGFPYRVGDEDPDLRLIWAGPQEEGDLPSCAWPPCEGRGRENSRYCSRKCGVRVAHRRDTLRKKEARSAKRAS